VLARDAERPEAHLLLASIMKAQFAETGDRAFRDAAEDHYRRALSVEPNDARALAGLGEIAAFSERPKEALAYALRANAADPDLPEARTLAATLFLRVGRAHLEQGDAAAAAEAARRADLLAGESAGLCLLRADIARKGKDWSAAGVEIERARALAPRSGEVLDAVAAHYRDVGYALLLHGRKDEAMVAFRRAIGADAPTTDLSEVRRIVDRGEGRPEEPLNPAVAEALEKSFVEARTLFDEGVRARAASDPAAAEAKFRASLRAFETAQARFGLGLILAERGDAAAAEAEYLAATVADPGFPDAWLNLGSLRFKRGDDPGAALAWEQYLRRAPEDAPAATVDRVRALLDGIRERALKAEGPK
jgi:Tfp pilus assembly protein PilF